MKLKIENDVANPAGNIPRETKGGIDLPVRRLHIELDRGVVDDSE
jgi:hypothetical protein